VGRGAAPRGDNEGWREYAWEHISPELREEVRRDAEPFRRALSLARYIGHHSRKGRDMR